MSDMMVSLIPVKTVELIGVLEVLSSMLAKMYAVPISKILRGIGERKF